MAEEQLGRVCRGLVTHGLRAPHKSGTLPFLASLLFWLVGWLAGFSLGFEFSFFHFCFSLGGGVGHDPPYIS